MRLRLWHAPDGARVAMRAHIAALEWWLADAVRERAAC